MFRTRDPKPVNLIVRTCSIVMVAAAAGLLAAILTWAADPQPAPIWAENPCNVWECTK